MLLTTVPVFAHDKVVVIPLSGVSNSTSSGDSWIRVYDKNNAFLGFLIDKYFFISENKYFTTVNYDSQKQVYHYQRLSSNSYFYLSSDCSGSLYKEISYNGSITPFDGPGEVGTIVRAPYDHFYIPVGATPITIPVATETSTYGFTDTCTSSVLPAPVDAFQFFLNDPLVTGFPNTIEAPLKAVYTLPTP